MGRHKSLVGIFANPAQSPVCHRPPHGRSVKRGHHFHRVGPNRMHVFLARALAAAGISSLRFDMSGIGDSPNRPEAATPLKSAMSDIHDAMEWLEASKQIRKVVLFGLFGRGPRGSFMPVPIVEWSALFCSIPISRGPANTTSTDLGQS